MKNFYTKVSLALLTFITALSVNALAQNHTHYEKCLAHHMYEEMLRNDPQFAENQRLLEEETALYSEQYISSRLNGNNQRNASVVRIIPVVFHIIHEGGAENISREQVLNQMELLNKDYRRLNDDTANTPVPFKALSGDAEIEFRLATLDPNGNCTDGIVRVFSTLTNDARDNVKALSYWPRDKYLNIWVVKTIENTSGSAGTILGFAQFPGGTASTDGVVMRSDVIGDIGTAANAGWSNGGRTAPHEVGHWLNLRHIWGDGTCASDFVTDTPTHQDANTGCPNFPVVSTMCNNGPNGEMFTNYMDYTNGTCQNMLSVGQCARMNAALSSPLSGRNNLWSNNNLIATGTNTIPGAVCIPTAEFFNNSKYICEGTTISFTDGSWNAAPDTWLWDFPGGTPSSSTDQNPSIQYNTAGTYDITLTVTNSAGSDTYTVPASVIVSPAVGLNTVPYSEGFESISFPANEWIVENGGGNTWVKTTNAAHLSTNSIYINNHSGNTTNTSDVFLTPTYNLSNVTSSNLTFWLAFAARSSASTDQLRVYASTTCGQLWSLRYNKSGLTLSTAGIISANFVPTAAQWRQETVNISSVSYNNKPNVRFKFDYTQNTGNNIYIDDINLDGTVGMNEVQEQALQFNVYPNPVISQATIEFTLTEKNDIQIDVIDVMGRVVNKISEKSFDAGEYQFELPLGLAAGLYSVRLNVNGFITARKVVVN